MRILLLLICACHPIPVSIAGTLPIAVIAAPKQPKPTCSVMPDLPRVPAEIVLDLEQQDVIVRTTVNIREYNELRQWSQDMAAWATSVQECIDRLTGGGE